MDKSVCRIEACRAEPQSPDIYYRARAHTDSPYSQGRNKHAGGCSHAIGPHHEGEGEEEQAGQGAEIKQEVCSLRQRLAKVDDQT